LTAKSFTRATGNRVQCDALRSKITDAVLQLRSSRQAARWAWAALPHDQLNAIHNQAHEEGLSPWEHERLHRQLDRAHDRADGNIEAEHELQHENQDF
jgi:hypothetical protein